MAGDNRPLRVVYVNHVSLCSGAEFSLLSLLRHVQEYGVEPHALVPEGDLAERLRDLEIPLTLLPEQRLQRTLNPRRLGAQLGWLREVRRTARAVAQETGADLLHANSLAAALALAQRGPALPPLVWHCRDLLMPRPALRWLAPRCAGIVAISHVVDQAIRQAAPARARCAVIYNGVEAEDLRPTRAPGAVRQEMEIPAEAEVVVSVAQLTPWKRLELAVEAARLLSAERPGLRWWIVGEAFPEDAEYARRLRESAPGQVIFTGYRREAPDLVAAADVFAHAATAEPFGRAVLEAMALGTPCVGPRAGGIPELLEHDVSGWLVEPGDAAALAAGVERLLGDPALRERLARAAQARARESFSAARTAEQTAAYYRFLLEKPA